MTREEFVINRLALKIAQNEVDAANQAYQAQQKQEQPVEEEDK